MAYCLDEAVGYVGRTISQEIEIAIEDADGRVNRERRASDVLRKYFNNDEDKPPEGQYADPALLFK